MSPVRRWKRLISPHGVFHVPKSAASLSDAAESDCRSCSADALLAMYSSAESPDLFASSATCRRMPSPQKTASDVGMEATPQRKSQVRSRLICSVSFGLSGLASEAPSHAL